MFRVDLDDTFLSFQTRSPRLGNALKLRHVQLHLGIRSEQLPCFTDGIGFSASGPPDPDYELILKTS